METRTLGKTGLLVSRLGMGQAEIGGAYSVQQEAEAGRVLNAALDAGITFLDTAECYGTAEELIGRTISHRRSDFVLATKTGHAVGDDPEPDWSPETVRNSIDRSLRRLQTDHVDLLQLHSCSVEVLERGDVIRILQDARQAGKTRFIGYSGDNDAARWAVQSGFFDTLQTSFNLVDQRARSRLFPLAAEKGMGIICKRPIANATWGADHAPSQYSAEYFERARKMAAAGLLPEAPESRIWLALGYVLAHAAVDTAIVGTRNFDHLLANIELLNTQPPLSTATITEVDRRFDELGGDWVQKG